MDPEAISTREDILEQVRVPAVDLRVKDAEDDADAVKLWPIVASDLDALARMRVDPAEAGEFSFFGWFGPRGAISDELPTEQGGRLAVRYHDTTVGVVSWHRVQHGPTSFCWNIGIGLLPSARGRGIGTRAQRRLVEYLFAHTQVNRIEADTETANIAEQRALEKAGFTREGVERGANYRAGAWRDMVLFSILRHEVYLA